MADCLLQPAGALWRPQGLKPGGVPFEATTVRLVEAGGAQDFRQAGHADRLRLGARFLANHCCLWNWPAETLTVLVRDVVFLRDGVASAGR